MPTTSKAVNRRRSSSKVDTSESVAIPSLDREAQSRYRILVPADGQRYLTLRRRLAQHEIQTTKAFAQKLEPRARWDGNTMMHQLMWPNVPVIQTWKAKQLRMSTSASILGTIKEGEEVTHFKRKAQRTEYTRQAVREIMGLPTRGMGQHDSSCVAPRAGGRNCSRGRLSSANSMNQSQLSRQSRPNAQCEYSLCRSWRSEPSRPDSPNDSLDDMAPRKRKKTVLERRKKTQEKIGRRDKKGFWRKKLGKLSRMIRT